VLEVVKVLMDTSASVENKYMEIGGWVCTGYKLDDNYMFYICNKTLYLSTEFYFNDLGYYISEIDVELGKIQKSSLDEIKYLKAISGKLESISMFDYLVSENFINALKSSGNTYINLHLTDPILPCVSDIENDTGKDDITNEN